MKTQLELIEKHIANTHTRLKEIEDDVFTAASDDNPDALDALIAERSRLNEKITALSVALDRAKYADSEAGKAARRAAIKSAGDLAVATIKADTKAAKAIAATVETLHGQLLELRQRGHVAADALRSFADRMERPSDFHGLVIGKLRHDDETGQIIAEAFATFGLFRELARCNDVELPFPPHGGTSITDRFAHRVNVLVPIVQTLTEKAIQEVQ